MVSENNHAPEIKRASSQRSLWNDAAKHRQAEHTSKVAETQADYQRALREHEEQESKAKEIYENQERYAYMNYKASPTKSHTSSVSATGSASPLNMSQWWPGSPGSPALSRATSSATTTPALSRSSGSARLLSTSGSSRSLAPTPKPTRVGSSRQMASPAPPGILRAQSLPLSSGSAPIHAAPQAFSPAPQFACMGGSMMSFGSCPQTGSPAPCSPGPQAYSPFQNSFSPMPQAFSPAQFSPAPFGYTEVVSLPQFNQPSTYQVAGFPMQGMPMMRGAQMAC